MFYKDIQKTIIPLRCYVYNHVYKIYDSLFKDLYSEDPNLED